MWKISWNWRMSSGTHSFCLMLKFEKLSHRAYHRRAVLKDEFPEKNNCIFGINMVDNPRRRWDLERVPLIISKKKFSKIQWILMRHNKKKIHASHWIRTSVAFAHAVYKPLCYMRSTSLSLFSHIVHLLFKIIFLINE